MNVTLENVTAIQGPTTEQGCGIWVSVLVNGWRLSNHPTQPDPENDPKFQGGRLFPSRQAAEDFARRMGREWYFDRFANGNRIILLNDRAG